MCSILPYLTVLSCHIWESISAKFPRFYTWGRLLTRLRRASSMASAANPATTAITRPVEVCVGGTAFAAVRDAVEAVVVVGPAAARLPP
jgi:hypothetical protein